MNSRLFVEAVLWLARTGAPWRDLPALFGNWNNAFIRFSRWSKSGVWDRLFATMVRIPIQSGQVFRFEAGQHSGMKPDAVPINHRTLSPL